MHYDNNATRTRRDLLMRVARLFFSGTFVEQIDRIPIDIRPKNKALRCCIYKDRAIIKYRLMAILGFRVEDETDELIPLHKYAQKAISGRRDTDSPILTLIDEACSACVQSKYFVTNACRGCMARPCTIVCPRKAITMGSQGQAQINPSSCVNCGLCMKVCPYHSIIRIPVPCEEACPVNAIEKDGDGKAIIDFDKCIFCGKCMRECPFGAIMECSEYIAILDALRHGKEMVLLLAPAVFGQFVAEPGQIVAAIKEAGFHAVVEVALGADHTARQEAAELQERLETGAPFMTTSCCPSYLEAVRKHVPELMEKVSTTATPMHYAAKHAEQLYPDSMRVFVSPCISKRNEARHDPFVDHVLTCEELGALIAAKGINIAHCRTVPLQDQATASGRGFPVSGGVTAAVRTFFHNPEKIVAHTIDGLSRQTMKQLKAYAARGLPGNFLEVMACEGGCVNGPCSMENPERAKQRIKKAAEGVDGSSQVVPR